MRILIVEDNEHLSQQIGTIFKESGYLVDIAYNGTDGWFLGDTEPYDTVILDLGLPVIDGISLLTRWRANNRHMPVLILSARNTWREKVVGLRAGADDYLAKPFELEELLARVEALIRRASGNAKPILEYGPVCLDTVANRVTVSSVPISLTALEFRTLSYFMHHQGRVISKSELIDHIYKQDFDRDSNTIEVIINRLRKKLQSKLIQTRRGQGYQLILLNDDVK